LATDYPINHSFIDAPEGIIAIDTGESIEEMQEAIAELRNVTSKPIAAVLYTHFHYWVFPHITTTGLAMFTHKWWHLRN
jgi:alkyl sulfatase BDS1-like metallo-beta-lactamase superfamily hydrolase